MSMFFDITVIYQLQTLVMYDQSSRFNKIECYDIIIFYFLKVFGVSFVS